MNTFFVVLALFLALLAGLIGAEVFTPHSAWLRPLTLTDFALASWFAAHLWPVVRERVH